MIPELAKRLLKCGFILLFFPNLLFNLLRLLFVPCVWKQDRTSESVVLNIVQCQEKSLFLNIGGCYCEIIHELKPGTISLAQLSAKGSSHPGILSHETAVFFSSYFI